MIANTHQIRIEQIHKHVTIFEVLAHFGIVLEEATQQIRCPFHEDRSPSARVYADQNKVYCFTCSKQWDVIDAAQTKLGVSLGEAMTWLEQQFGVPGVLQTLTSTVRTKLAQRQPPSIQASAQMIEARLKQERRRLGFDRYTRLLLGLDISVWEVSEKKLSPEQFETRMAELLAAMR